MIINKLKSQIAELKKKRTTQKELEFLARYLGSDKKYLGAKTGDLVKIAKQFLRENKDIEAKELAELIGNLVSGDSFEEHVVGGKIFTFIKPDIRQQIPFSEIEKWLSGAKGWVEVDVICQSAYTAKEVQENFAAWQKNITKLSKNKIISLRRASLVLQTRPNREISDDKMRRLAFETIDRLKHEEDVLITKAISWLLRSLTNFKKEEVRKYLEDNQQTLPRIAYRETMKKIDTGKKTGAK